MKLRKILSIAMLQWLVAATATAANWQPVPGAPDLQVDTDSIRLESTRAVAWVRWWGRSAILPELSARSARALRIHRTSVLTEFDCGRRQVRGLVAQAYGSGGAPLVMSSVPGPALPLGNMDIEWAYDAVCEAARSGGKG